MNISDIYDSILNKKQEQVFLTASVVTVSPLTIELIPSDTPLSCINTTHLVGLKVNSRILVTKFQNQFIALAIIDEPTNWIKYIRKTANQTATSTTTIVNDTHFNITLPINSTYEIKVCLEATGSNSGNLRLAWAKGSGVTAYNRIISGPDQIGGSVNSTLINMNAVAYNAEVPYTTDGSSASSIIERFLVTTTGTLANNTLIMKWAQWASNGTPTTLTSNSFMTIKKLEAF